MKLSESTSMPQKQYSDHLNARMTELLRAYANRFEVMSDADKEIQIVLFRSITETDEVSQKGIGNF